MSNIRMRVAAPEALRMSAEPVRVVEAVSPKVSFESVEGGVRVTVQDVEGTHVTLIPAGRGEQGVGISSITMDADYTLTITLDDGTSYTTPSIRGEAGADGAPGKDGQDGTDGVSPTVTVTDITGGHRVTITDAEHPQGISFDVMNGETPDVPVQDVQVNGTSVVTNGVANVPVANITNPGVIKVDPYYGITKTNDDKLRTNYASIDTIKLGNQYFAPIVPYTQHVAAFYGFAKAAGDTTQSASSNTVGSYTDAAKVAIQKMLGVYREWELIAEETVAEDSEAYNIETDLSGQPFALSEMYVRVWLKPSTTGTNDYMSARALVITKADATSSVSAPTKRYMASGAASFFDYHCRIFGGVTYCTGTASSSAGSTGSIERITSNDDIYKVYRGFSMQRYGAQTSLIPKDTVIKIYGIRA